MHQLEGFEIFLDAKNNGAVHLDLAYLGRLSVIIAINEQLKYLTHMFCL
jgi:hypothetical protein